MNGLFRKVVKGIYPRIPKVFSADLKYVAKQLLLTKPSDRPSCD